VLQGNEVSPVIFVRHGDRTYVIQWQLGVQPESNEVQWLQFRNYLRTLPLLGDRDRAMHYKDGDGDRIRLSTPGCWASFMSLVHAKPTSPLTIEVMSLTDRNSALPTARRGPVAAAELASPTRLPAETHAILDVTSLQNQLDAQNVLITNLRAHNHRLQSQMAALRTQITALRAENDAQADEIELQAQRVIALGG